MRGNHSSSKQSLHGRQTFTITSVHNTELELARLEGKLCSKTCYKTLSRPVDSLDLSLSIWKMGRIILSGLWEDYIDNLGTSNAPSSVCGLVMLWGGRESGCDDGGTRPSINPFFSRLCLTLPTLPFLSASPTAGCRHGALGEAAESSASEPPLYHEGNSSLLSTLCFLHVYM
jgi:hypothetical protein